MELKKIALYIINVLTILALWGTSSYALSGTGTLTIRGIVGTIIAVITTEATTGNDFADLGNTDYTTAGVGEVTVGTLRVISNSGGFTLKTWSDTNNPTAGNLSYFDDDGTADYDAKETTANSNFIPYTLTINQDATAVINILLGVAEVTWAGGANDNINLTPTTTVETAATSNNFGTGTETGFSKITFARYDVDLAIDDIDAETQPALQETTGTDYYKDIVTFKIVDL